MRVARGRMPLIRKRLKTVRRAAPQAGSQQKALVTQQNPQIVEEVPKKGPTKDSD